MCAPLSPCDEIEPPSLREKAENAWTALAAALRARHLLLLDIDEGATSSEFARGLPDERLRNANKAAFEARAVYEQTAHDLMHGEVYRGTFTSMSLAIAMQFRVSRNDKAAGVPVPSAHLPAIVSPAGA